LFRMFGIFPSLDRVAVSLRDVVAALIDHCSSIHRSRFRPAAAVSPMDASPKAVGPAVRPDTTARRSGAQGPH
jgi:hypothetical protein